MATILHRRGVKLRRRGATPLADTERVKIPPEKMVELYLVGNTLEQVAALAGSNRGRVAAILKRRGVEIRRPSQEPGRQFNLSCRRWMSGS